MLMGLTILTVMVSTMVTMLVMRSPRGLLDQRCGWGW